MSDCARSHMCSVAERLPSAHAPIRSTRSAEDCPDRVPDRRGRRPAARRQRRRPELSHGDPRRERPQPYLEGQPSTGTTLSYGPSGSTVRVLPTSTARPPLTLTRVPQRGLPLAGVKTTVEPEAPGAGQTHAAATAPATRKTATR